MIEQSYPVQFYVFVSNYRFVDFNFGVYRVATCVKTRCHEIRVGSVASDVIVYML